MDIIQKSLIFAKKEYKKNDPMHQWNHIEAVMKRAMEIANQLENIDYKLLKLGIIFHDIDYNSEDNFEENYKNHVKNSAKIAEKFLKKENYPKEDIKRVKKIIYSHSTPHREKFGDTNIKEGKILYDADKSIFIKDPNKYKKYYSKLYFSISKKLVLKQLNNKFK
ncbi:MAG TPA: HD domain-containing protein [Candidatus Nanoarchaeia archaeon]|nr:HD domain-containing protein [Candidatus Nanoarchaeia archaeon]